MTDLSRQAARPIVRRHAAGESAREVEERLLSVVEAEVVRATLALTGLRPTNFGFMRVGMRLDGCLDRAALERAAHTLGERHDIWRTSFHVRDDQAYARLDPVVPTVFRFVECATEQAVEAVIESEIAAGFTLSEAPLHRWLLVRLSDHVHIFFHFAHHSIFDGFAHSLLFRELGALYDAHHAGTTPKLPSVLQYSDVAIAEEASLTPAVRAAHQAFWSRHLVEGAPRRPLASMAERPAGQRLFRAERYRTDLACGLDLVAYCKARGRDLHVVLLASLAAMLEAEGAGATPIAHLSTNRRRETMRVLGNFTKYLPLRIPVERSDSFDVVADRTHAILEACAPYHDLPPPFEPTKGALPYRLFFNCYKQSPWLKLDGVEVTVLGVFEKTHVVFDLELNFVLDLDGAVRLMVYYNAELITQPQLLDFLGRYEQYLRSAID